MTLEEYGRKGNFGKISAQPPGKVQGRDGGSASLIQKDNATRSHYGFGLELHGVLLGWAAIKGPSLNSADNRLAVRTEDRPSPKVSHTVMTKATETKRRMPRKAVRRATETG